MTSLETANLGLRFVLELCVLAALAYWGFTIDLVLGFIFPIPALIVWGNFVAPRAKRRLDDPLRLAVEIVFFASGVIALVLADAPIVAAVLAVAIVIHVGLMIGLKQR